MAGNGSSDPAEATAKVGTAFALIGGLIGYTQNGIGGAVIGAVAGFTIGAALVRLLGGIAMVITGGMIVLAAYASIRSGLNNLKTASTPAVAVSPNATVVPSENPAPDASVPPVVTSGQTGWLDRLSGGEDVRPVQPRTAAKSSGHTIRFTNSCRLPVHLFIHWQEPTTGSTTSGYWSVAPNGVETLSYDNNTPLRAASSEIYFYAFSTNGAIEWNGPHKERLENAELNMLKANISATGDSFGFSIGCDGR